MLLLVLYIIISNLVSYNNNLYLNIKKKTSTLQIYKLHEAWEPLFKYSKKNKTIKRINQSNNPVHIKTEDERRGSVLRGWSIIKYYQSLELKNDELEIKLKTTLDKIKNMESLIININRTCSKCKMLPHK